MPIREIDGRFRLPESSAAPRGHDATDAMREVLTRTCVAKTASVEVGGRIYLSEIYQNTLDPTEGYVETDRDGVPLGTPTTQWKELSEQFRDVIHFSCHGSDSLTPDTRMALDSSFVRPEFELHSEEGSVALSWQSISDYARVLISGPPGSGKTSCLRRLALEAMEQTHSIPLFLQLRSIKPESLTVEGLERLLTSQGGDAQLDELRAPSEGSSIVLLLDGLDETPGDREQRELVEAINRLCFALPRIRIFVTSRDYTPAVELLKGFSHISIRPASDQWIRQWILLYFAKKGDVESADDLSGKLASDPELRELSRTPLLLSLITSCFRHLPGSIYQRADLIDNCTETLLTGWDSARDVRRWGEESNTPRQLRTLLRDLSLKLLEERRSVFTANDVDLTKWTLHGSSPVILLNACASTGIIRDVAANTWSFAHTSFQDYFAASQLVSRTKNSTGSIEKRLNEPSVRRALAMSCSLASDPDDLLRSVINQDHRSSYSTALLLSETLCAESSASSSVLRECANLVVNAIEDQMRDVLIHDAVSPWEPPLKWHARPGSATPKWVQIVTSERMPSEGLEMLGYAIGMLRRACFGPMSELVQASMSKTTSASAAGLFEGLCAPGNFESEVIQSEQGWNLILAIFPKLQATH